MTTDANEVDDSVLLPSKTSNETIDDAIAESSPEAKVVASEEKHEPKQDGTQKRFNKLTYEKYEAIREVDKLKLELEAARQVKPEPIQPEVSKLVEPKLPDDMYDEEAMRKYHSSMIQYSTQVAQDTANTTFEQRQTQSQQAEQIAGKRKSLNKYIDNAIKDGVDVEKLPHVETTLNNAGINPQLGQYLIADPNGAKIAEYLVDNPALMYEVLQMDPVSAGIKISTEIKGQALSKTPKVSGAPDPIKEVVGGGYVEKDEFNKVYPGATFI